MRIQSLHRSGGCARVLDFNSRRPPRFQLGIREDLRMADDEGVAEGVYRDGRYLVVDLRSSRFPFRCVKTNRRVRYHSSHVIRLRQRAVIAYTLWCAAFIYVRWKLTLAYGVLGQYVSVAFLVVTYLVLTSVIRRSQILWIGIDEEFAERRKRNARLGWRVVLGGLIGLIIVGAAEVGAVLAGLLSSPNVLMNLVPVGFALLALSGFPFLIIAHLPILWYRKRKESFLWLGGANRDFLTSLPAWEPGGGNQSLPGETQDDTSMDEGT